MKAKLDPATLRWCARHIIQHNKAVVEYSGKRATEFWAWVFRTKAQHVEKALSNSPPSRRKK